MRYADRLTRVTRDIDALASAGTDIFKLGAMYETTVGYNPWTDPCLPRDDDGNILIGVSVPTAAGVRDLLAEMLIDDIDEWATDADVAELTTILNRQVYGL